MSRVRFSSCPPWLVLLLVTGAMLAGLLVGFEPIGGDPDRLYRPIKLVVAAALRQGALPFWSDAFGLGVPLAAESHAAAFYPANWLLYRLLAVPVAYRLAMWLHYLATAAGTYGYARLLKISRWGSALAALAFTFCGFQAIHSSHEPFYQAIAYLPLALIVVNQYAATGRLAWLALLSLCLGVQLTLGHFQIQAWTALLALAAGGWQILAERRPARRIFGVLIAVGWGVAIAAVQLLLTAEFAQHADWGRGSIDNISFYSYPPAHLAELAIPWLFQGLRGGPENAYWFSLGATGFEACFYLGTIPLVLAMLGLCALRGDAMLRFWAIVVLPVSLAMATLPHWALVTVANWWTAGYLWLLQVPGLGAFRAPARYTLLASLALALLAGRGFDRAAEAKVLTRGLALAISFAVVAGIWAYLWTRQPLLRSSLGTLGIASRLGEAALAWIIAVGAIVAWRQGRLSPVALLLISGLELGSLYYSSTTDWGWSIRLPEASRVLRRLAAEGGDGARVACALDDLPVRARAAPLVPYLAVSLPPIGRFVRPANSRGWTDDPRAARWLRRYGARFGIWDRPVLMPGAEVLLQGHDEALDRLAYRVMGAPKHPTWTLVRYPGAFPQVRVVTKVLLAPDLRTMSMHLSEADRADEAWFLAEDLPEATRERRATRASLRSWKGLSGDVEHDGACYLLVSRTYYPGWTVQLNEGAPIAVSRAEGGIQALLIPGSGVTRVSLHYEPTWLKLGLGVSTVAAGSALLVLAVSLLMNRRRQQPSRDVTPPASSAAPAPPPPPAA